MPFAKELSASNSRSHPRAYCYARFCAPICLLAGLLLCALLGACAAPPAFPRAPIATATAAAPSFWQSAAQPFTNTVLHGITENSPPSLYVRNVLAPAFAKETGIAVELQISNNTAIEQIIAAGGQGYDFVYIEQDVIYGYLEAQRLVNLTKLLAEHRTLNSSAFNLIDFTGFIREFIEPDSSDLYGVPIEAFVKPYLYRTDLFGDPALQAAFAAEYHYPLAPAITFQQYRDIAAFFTHYGQANELALWGTTVQGTTTGIPSFYEFFETIAPSFGVYNWGINLETYAATAAHGGQLDSKQAIEALTFWVDLLQYAPPEAPYSDWNRVAASFAAGRTAQAWVYGENMAWIATDPTRSQVVGKVGVALPPTAPGVMEAATIGTGYLGYYDGAAFGIPIASQHKAAALLWLQYLGQAAVQPDWASESGRVVHFSTFDNGLVKAQDRRLNGYYSLMKEHGNLFAGAPPFPFHAQIRDIITPYIHQAIRQELTPTQALQQAAIAVEAELSRLGYRD
jgi:multiple sugar transport system substrate-binding protein